MAMYLGGREAGAGSPLHGSPAAARSRPGGREGQSGGGRGRRRLSSLESNHQRPGQLWRVEQAGCAERAGREKREQNNVRRGAGIPESGVMRPTGSGVDPACCGLVGC